jgi:hypothetical protein
MAKNKLNKLAKNDRGERAIRNVAYLPEALQSIYSLYKGV